MNPPLTDKIQLGERLFAIREEQKLTQQQVADAAGLIRQNIYRIEKGKYNISFNTLVQITRALGCTVEICPKTEK